MQKLRLARRQGCLALPGRAPSRIGGYPWAGRRRSRHCSRARSIPQHVAHALFERIEIVTQAPGEPLALRDKFDARHQGRVGRVVQVEVDAEGIGDRLVNGPPLGGRQFEGAPNDDLILGGIERRRKRVPCRAFEPSHASHEQLASAGLQADARQVGECLARDGKHLGLSALAHGLHQSLRFAGQGFLALGCQRVGSVAGGVHQPLAFSGGLVGGLLQQRRMLLLEVIVLLLEFVTLMPGLGLLAAGRGKFARDAIFSCIDGVQDRLVKKALHQPRQDDEVQRLRRDGEPVDHHGYFPATLAACAIAAFQKGLAKIRIIDTTKQ